MASPDAQAVKQLALEEPDPDVKMQLASPDPAALQDEQPPQSQTEAGSEESEASATPTQKGRATCGVCETSSSKYKCPRCYFPYCSIGCNKIHQENHPPPDPKPEPVPQPPSNLPAKPAGPPNPFRALDNSEKLAWLFRKYPNLPQQLLDIYAATQPPPEDPSKQIPASLMQGMPRRNNWSRDKGVSRGKAALRKARQLPGVEGEAIREYCALILLLLNDEDSDDGSRAVLQQQLAQEDADIIRQLMEEEKGLR